MMCLKWLNHLKWFQIVNEKGDKNEGKIQRFFPLFPAFFFVCVEGAEHPESEVFGARVS